MTANTKIILLASTPYSFVKSSMGHTEYFVNDDVFYDLKTLHVSFSTVNFRKLTYLPFNNLVLLKGYFTTIELVTKNDRKKRL